MQQGGIKFANQQTLSWEDYPGSSRWAQCEHKRKETGKSQCGSMWEGLNRSLLTVGMEEKDYELRNAESLQKLENARKGILL